jgi:hypothetical protein
VAIGDKAVENEEESALCGALLGQFEHLDYGQEEGKIFLLCSSSQGCFLTNHELAIHSPQAILPFR